MIDPKYIEQIAVKYRIALVYLFGSRAKNTESKLSDIDIAVFLENPSRNINQKDMILGLIYDFAQLFGSDKIDLLLLNKASLAIQFEVISKGKILYQANSQKRYSYEERVVKLYLDFKKFEDEYYKAMHRKILEA